MKKIVQTAALMSILVTLTATPEVGVGVGFGVGGGYPYGPYYGGPAIGVGLGFGPSYPKGAIDYMSRDYWRIDNNAPFPITVQSDRSSKTIRPGKRMVKLHRYGDFNFMVIGGGRQNKVGSQNHNLSIGLDQKGNLQIINSWNQ